MKRLHHLTVEQYVDTGRGRRSTGGLALLAHRHVLELCPDCRAEWQLLAQSREGVLERLGETGLLPPDGGRPPAPGAELRDPVLSGPESFAAREVLALEESNRRRRRKAVQELWELLRLPEAEWPGKVRRARRRFRSWALAELLTDECRNRARTAPRQAAALASLVPAVLVRFREDEERPSWATGLLVQAEARRANALRIAGDLPAAARLFTHLRAEMVRWDVTDPALIAEVASLRASLHIDQRAHGEAEADLSVARLVAQRAGERDLYLRVLVKLANLQGTLGNTERSLKLFEEAERLLGHEVDGYLGLSVATGCIVGLCELERFREAEERLIRHQEVFEAQDDPHLGATLSALRGRLERGLGRLDDAVASFGMARDALLALGRHYDAALACLDLAETHLLRGDAAALKRLALRLGGLFRAHGVGRETLAVLQLLARAVVAEQVSETMLEELRDRLKRDRNLSG